MLNGNFFNSLRVVGSATFTPLTANFNAGWRERGREINGGTSCAADQRTDRFRPGGKRERERVRVHP